MGESVSKVRREQKIEFIRANWSHIRYRNKKEKVVIVVAGKSGAGKSTLINNFLGLEGIEATRTSTQPTSVTRQVDFYDKNIYGVDVTMVDMPGLHASEHENDEAARIIYELQALTGGNADVLFYCMNLITRADKVDFENIDTLNNVFGRKIWEHTIFVFTYSDVAIMNGSNLEELVGMFIDVIRQHLVEKRKVNVEIRSIFSFEDDGVSEDAEINKFGGIVGIPTSKNPTMPPEWRLMLLLQVIRKCKKGNNPGILSIDWDELTKTSKAVVSDGARGAAIGTAMGIGIGGILGAVFSGGVGALAGVKWGAAIGATIGGSISARNRIVLENKVYNKEEERMCKKIKEMIERERSVSSSDT